MRSPVIAPKVKALQANPTVALSIDTSTFPPHVLPVRRAAALEIVEDMPDEFIESSRRFVGEAGMPEWEATVLALYK